MEESIQIGKVILELEGRVGSFPEPDNDLVELFSNTDFSGLYLTAGAKSRERKEELPVPLYFDFCGDAKIVYQKTEKNLFEDIVPPCIVNLKLGQWSYEGQIAFKAGIWKLPSGGWHLTVYIKTDCKEYLDFYGKGRLTIIQFY